MRYWARVEVSPRRAMSNSLDASSRASGGNWFTDFGGWFSVDGADAANGSDESLFTGLPIVWYLMNWEGSKRLR